MKFQYVQPKKGSDLVRDQIRERIQSGDLLPGNKLPSVVDLATTFGVGRSTVREALSALKAMGFVQIRQGGGTFVSDGLPEGNEHEQRQLGLTRLFQHTDSIKQILEVRKVLETGCASLAAINRNDDDMMQLQQILKHMEENLESEHIGEAADIQFHLTIAEATHNPILLEMMQSLSQRMQETMKESRMLWFYGEHASAKRLLQEHKMIAEAIQSHNETLAGSRMLKHLMKVETVLISLL